MDLLIDSLDPQLARAVAAIYAMDADDELEHDSSPPSGAETPKSSDDAQLRASLQTYLDSLPYEAESPEEMHAKLDEIVQKLAVCAKARDWNSLTTWDSLLQW